MTKRTTPTKTWKRVELEIARRYFNGQRRGADFRDKENGGGKTDVVAPGWAIEIKHSKRPSYGLMLDAVLQAKTNQEHPDDIPVAVIHRHGDEYRKCLAVMTAPDFDAHFSRCTAWVPTYIGGKRIMTEKIYAALEKSRASARPNQLPAVIVWKDDDQPLLVMCLEDFAAWFVGSEGEEGGQHVSSSVRWPAGSRSRGRRSILQEHPGQQAPAA